MSFEETDLASQFKRSITIVSFLTDDAVVIEIFRLSKDVAPYVVADHPAVEVVNADAARSCVVKYSGTPDELM